MEDFSSEVPHTIQNYDNQPIITDEAFDQSQQGLSISK